MKKNFTAVAPAKLREVWAKVLPGLNKIEKPDGFINEDVYVSLLSGSTVLFMLEVDDVDAGWVMLEKVEEFGKKRLHIWLCFSDANKNILSVFDEDVTNVAKDIGASSISFGSTQRFWERVAPKHGFHPRETIYVRPIE